MSDLIHDILTYPKKDSGPTTRYVVMSEDELVQLVRGAVHNTLIEVGLKSNSLQSGKIYRKDMVEVIGERGFQKAVKSGQLKVRKDGNRTSKVYALHKDWEYYLKMHINQKV